MQSQLDFEQDVKNLGVRVRVIPNVLLRQRLRIVRLVLRKVLPKDFRQMIHKKLEILRILEIFAQERFKRREATRPKQARFQPAPPQNLPLQRCHIGCQHLFYNIARLYRCEHTGEKLVIGVGVFALDEGWWAKQRQSRGGGQLYTSYHSFCSMVCERDPTRIAAPRTSTNSVVGEKWLACLRAGPADFTSGTNRVRIRAS